MMLEHFEEMTNQVLYELSLRNLASLTIDQEDQYGKAKKSDETSQNMLKHQDEPLTIK